MYYHDDLVSVADLRGLEIILAASRRSNNICEGATKTELRLRKVMFKDEIERAISFQMMDDRRDSIKNA